MLSSITFRIRPEESQEDFDKRVCTFLATISPQLRLIVNTSQCWGQGFLSFTQTLVYEARTEEERGNSFGIPC